MWYDAVYISILSENYRRNGSMIRSHLQWIFLQHRDLSTKPGVGEKSIEDAADHTAVSP